MFSFFKKKSKIEILEEQYQKLQKEAFDLSKINRKKSDEKFAEAEAVLNEIKALEV